MNELHAALQEYLSVRRALGVKLRLPGRLLERFVDFAEREGATVITTDLALRWATQPADTQPAAMGQSPGDGATVRTVSKRGGSAH
jgi:integrase/recombinase XerD